MAKKIKTDYLSKAIAEELMLYGAEVSNAIKKKNDECMKQFVKDTKKDAPKGKRKKFYKHITSQTVVETPNKKINRWYVKDPEYRLTHLIKNGHQTRNGKRETKAQDFITDNYEKMVKDYENGIKEVVEHGH